MKCPDCGFDSPPEMRFCGRCGARLKQICPVCNFANSLDYNFCGMCGASFAAEPSRPQPAQHSGAPLVETQQISVQPVSKVSSPPEAMPIVLAGERRLVTVILADVVRSTDILEQIGTEAWVEEMSQVLQIMETEIYRLGGNVDQFRGDGLVAFFGATSAHEDDPERAVLAGLAIQKAIKSFAVKLADAKGIMLQVRVGINTGEVILTSVGNSRQYREDTAMGEAVALAARMEAAAEPGTVLVSENSYTLIQSKFEWMPLGEILVKGVSQPITVYRPLALRTGARPLRRLQIYGLKTPLIGREAEFETLKRCVHELDAGKGAIVMVTGDKGAGKSLIVNEVRQHVLRDVALFAEAFDRDKDTEVSALRSLLWLQGRCRSYDHAQPYSAWRSLLWNWLGVYEELSDSTTTACLSQEAQLLWGDRQEDFYPYLAHFLSLPLVDQELERVKRLDAEGLRQQFYRAIRHWVVALTKRGPLVLNFSDIHWADATSLDLLKYCLPLTDQNSLLWLMTFRPERASAAWEFRHRVETEYPHRLISINLPPLSRLQSEQMIDQLIGPDVLPVKMRNLILDKAEGNPYYIEELIRSLIEQGVLAHDTSAGKWQATRAVVSLAYLPDTLQSLLLARIDGLSVEERQMLQMASVIGTVFWSKVLEALTGQAAKSREYLTNLQRAQLIDERGRVPGLGMEYVFKSNLTRDAVYESLLSPQRVKYHRQIAEFLETQFGQAISQPYYGMLAFHYGRARERGKELLYTHLAAQQAKRVYANTEALELYSWALELLDEIEAQADSEQQRYAIRTQRFDLLDGRREIYNITGNFEAERADARALLPLARQLDDDPIWLIDALLQQPGVTNWVSSQELEAGLPIADEALTLARRVENRHREMQCLIAISNQQLSLGDYTAALDCAEQALEIARQLDDRYYQARIFITMSQIYSWSNEPERGLEYLQLAMPISQALDDKLAEADVLGQIGLQFERYGDYVLLLTEYHQRRLQISRQIGHRPLEAQALLKCGEIQGIYLGDYAGGLALVEEAAAIWHGTPHQSWHFLRVALISTMQGEYDQALAALERAQQIQLQEAQAKVLVQAGHYLVSAKLYIALKSEAYLRQALDCTAELYQLADENPFLTRQFKMAAACEAVEAHLSLAELSSTGEERQAQRRQALEASGVALEIYQRFGFTQVIECVGEEILFRHSQALAANGHTTQAAEYLQRAYDEMMSKYTLIPSDSPFRRTFLENIPLHRELQAARSEYALDPE